MAKKALTGEIRERHVQRCVDEIAATGARLGIDPAGICEAISKPNQQEVLFDRPYVRIESNAWGCSGTLMVQFTADAESNLGFTAKCELNWSATMRDIARAVQVVALYTRLIELAAVIEGVVG